MAERITDSGPYVIHGFDRDGLHVGFAIVSFDCWRVRYARADSDFRVADQSEAEAKLRARGAVEIKKEAFPL